MCSPIPLTPFSPTVSLLAPGPLRPLPVLLRRGWWWGRGLLLAWGTTGGALEDVHPLDADLLLDPNADFGFSDIDFPSLFDDSTVASDSTPTPHVGPGAIASEQLQPTS